MNEVVSHWTSVVNGRTRKIKFVHHLISGRRQLYIDDQLVHKTGYKLDLCGQEHVYHDGHKFEVLIGAKSVFEFQYFLFIDGQSPEDYSRAEQRKHVYWRVKVHQKEYLIGFGKRMEI
ncbi:hypothetical protein FGIG_01492 [Fasciola gigantica]|uniref:Fas apoptotic inhibitory molecule 1 n=1 Tax=Fasciola gigantica TaxID=46835 RepID=A0A504YNC2_FASGI|nr:hypothetical protein FGIG_01492 [Fasciola gigantica]